MYPKLTAERIRRIQQATKTMAAMSKTPIQDHPNPDRAREEAHRVIRELHDARIAMQVYLGELPKRDDAKRTYRRDAKLTITQIVQFLMAASVLNQRTVASATRAFNRMVKRGELTHPYDAFGRFIDDVFRTASIPKDQLVRKTKWHFKEMNAEIAPMLRRFETDAKRKTNTPKKSPPKVQQATLF